jgi:hypothetical protein
MSRNGRSMWTSKTVAQDRPIKIVQSCSWKVNKKRDTSFKREKGCLRAFLKLLL